MERFEKTVVDISREINNFLDLGLSNAIAFEKILKTFTEMIYEYHSRDYWYHNGEKDTEKTLELLRDAVEYVKNNLQ